MLLGDARLETEVETSVRPESAEEIGSSQPDTRHQLEGIDVHIPPGFTTVRRHDALSERQAFARNGRAMPQP